MLDAYASFSPAIVRDMDADPALKDAVLTYVVQPVVTLVRLVDLYVQVASDTSDLLDALDQSVVQYAAEVAGAGGSADALAATGAPLGSAAITKGPETVGLHRDRFRWPRDLYSYLASVIRSNGRDAPGFPWALEGVRLVRRHATERWNDGARITPEFPHALGAWLARVPIPADALLNLTDARQELETLRECLFTRQYTRELFAQHLLARAPETSKSTLLSMLREMDYIRVDH
jgi:hypothetical protein